MPLVTDRDKQVIRSVLDRLRGMVGYEDDIDRLYKVVAGFTGGGNRGDFRYRQGIHALSACEIAVAFIRLSEDLKEQLSSRGEVAPQGMARLEAQVSANKSRIEELEKQFASLEESVVSIYRSFGGMRNGDV